MSSNKPASLARLSAMSWDELWVRSRQGVLKRWDAGLYRFRRGLDGAVPLPHRESSRTTNESQARFFWNASDLPQLITLMREKLSHEMEQTVEEADRICQHRLDLLGYRGLDFGPEIDWHLDVVHGKRAPRKPWFKILYLDFDEVGDHKIIWELNRHQHLVTLAKAWCCTREERYVAELLRQWYHWQQENPYPIGINWASSLEVGFRTLSWLWVRHLLADSSLVTERVRLDLLRALALNGRHIERYLSTYFSPNTHLLGEAVALFSAGTLCPQLPRARRWRQRGWKMVLQEAERQVQSDGMHFEQSVYYHVYALDFFLHARILAACNEIPIPAAFDQTIEKMLEVLCALSQAGPPPRLGDDDGGRVFNPRRNLAEHLLDPLATGALLFRRADFKAAVGGLREETAWLLGPGGITRFEELPLAQRSPDSVRLACSGVHVMASADPVPQQLVIDAGAQGTGTAGHGHADALSLCLSVNGREWLADAGTFSYVSTGTARDSFRGTAAHSTLQVDGLSQADPDGPFAWRSLPQVHVDQWVSGETFDLFAGSHTGYRRLPEPVLQRRWVFHLKSHFWLIRDVAEGGGPHQLDLTWQLGEGIVLLSAPSNGAVLFGTNSAGDKQQFAFVPLQNHGWSQQVRQGSVSPVYGRQEPAAVLRFGTRTDLPAEFAILLLSSARDVEKPGVLTEIRETGSPARGYCYTRSSTSHYVFFAEGGKNWNLGPWESDAQFLYFGTASDGGQHCIICDGSYAQSGGQRVALKYQVPRFELVTDGAGRQTYCSDASMLSHLGGQDLVMPERVL